MILLFNTVLGRFRSVLASNMGPSWGPRWLQNRKIGFQKLQGSSQRAVRNATLLVNTVLGRFGFDFWCLGVDLRRIWVELSTFLVCFRLLLLGGARLSWPGFWPSCQEQPRARPAKDREREAQPERQQKNQTAELPGLPKGWAAVSFFMVFN